MMRILAAALALSLASTALTAQGKVKLTVTGGPITFNAPATSDFDNGYIAAPGPVTYTVAGQGGPKNGSLHTTTIAIRATTATLNGTTPIGDLTWRRSDLATWNPLTTSNVFVETKQFSRKLTNDPWTNDLYFRLNLSYAGDPPGAYSTSLIITVTVTTP